jgi:phosphate-selective porin OprO/OprP
MRRLARVAATVLLLGGPLAFAQEAAAPTPDTTLQQIQELKKQVEALSQQVKVLERQQELAKEEQAAKAKTTPVVTAGKDGVSIGTPDKAFTMKIGGFLGYDWSWFGQDDDLKYSVGDEQDGTGFNFARIRLSGTVYDNIEYVMEYDFATQNGADGPEFKDVYLQLNDIPYGGDLKGSLRAGHFREPMSFEELMSVRYRMFMERSIMNAFIPSRNPGIQWSDALFGEEKQERMTYALGVFKDADNWPSSNDSDEDQGYTITGRVTGLPYYAYGGRQLVHLGAAYSHRNPDGATLGWAARPENKLSLFRYATTEGQPLYRLSNARADDVNLYNFELASVMGPFTFQGEYTLADVDTTFDNNRQFSGYYASLGYFLTGEYRPYRNNTGVFDKVKPLKNFGWKAEDGWGAWEVAARYSSVDLDDGGVRGGQQDDITVGLNWYLNPNTRIIWNYIHGDVDHDLYDGDFDALEMRFQVEF